jgi:hypothetical protein
LSICSCYVTLAVVGALVVIFSLYGARFIQTTLGIPRDAVEIVGFAGLIAAAIWLNARCPTQTFRRQKRTLSVQLSDVGCCP